MPEPTEQMQQSPLPMNPDLMGYPSVEALVAAKRAGDSEAKRLVGEVEKRDQLLAQIAVNGVAANQRTVPERRGGSAWDRLTEFGVPVDAIREVTQEVVRESLAPLSRGIQARGKVVSEHPDYVQFENDVAHFINTDPDLSRSYPGMFEADPVGAMEYAFLKFGDSRRRSGAQPEGRPSVPADASIPTSRSGDGRRPQNADSAARDAFERWQSTGSRQDAEAFARARLGPLLKEQFRRQGQEL